MSESKETLNRANFVRRAIMLKPESTLEQIQASWVELGNSKENLPNAQDLHTARTVIRRKYGVDDPKDIPRKKNGELNIVGILRLVHKKYPNYKMAQVRKHIGFEGISFNNSLWAFMKRQERQKANQGLVEQNDFDSPDPNQNNGSRARLSKRPGRPYGSKNKTKLNSNVVSEVDLLKIESALDEIINQVQNSHYNELAQVLRNARRYVSKDILNSSH